MPEHIKRPIEHVPRQRRRWLLNLDTTGLHLTTGQCYPLDVYLKANSIRTSSWHLDPRLCAIFKPRQ